MKACSQCGKLKPQEDFQVRKASKDGVTSACRVCLRKYDKARGCRVRPGYALEYRTKNPQKRSAQVALNNALRDGKISALPCLICGEKAEAHHTHYDAPLEVVWLCPAHHKQAHAMARAA